jgi:hypothetical protein
MGRNQMKLLLGKKFILLVVISVVLTGCVAMREKPSLQLPSIESSQPSVYLTVSYAQFKNGERWAFMNETSRRSLLKTARRKLEQSGLFGDVHTEPAKTDLQIHCALRADYTPESGGEFWLNVFTFLLYPTDSSWEYTLDTTVLDRRANQKEHVRANDIMTINSSLLFLVAAPFNSIPACSKEIDKYLFESSIVQIARRGLLSK